MTAQRREMHRFPQLHVGFWMLLALPLLSAPCCAATTEHLVTDRFSGLAIGGYDPVSFFANGAPAEGREDYEVATAGAVWRFRNEGNRASFASDPQVYAPLFGGYDPVDVARGVARAGQPQYWLIVEGRLYLFGDGLSRDAFAAAPQEWRQAAIGAWSRLRETLAR